MNARPCSFAVKPRRARNSPGNAGLPVACGLVNETGYPRRGDMEAVNNRIDPATGVLRMRAVLPNSDGLILPGMSVRVRLTMSGPYKAVLVPDRAITSIQGNKQVLVVTPANVIEPRPVKLGPLHDGLRVVKDGLKAEDNVVVRGGHARAAGDDGDGQENRIARAGLIERLYTRKKRKSKPNKWSRACWLAQSFPPYP